MNKRSTCSIAVMGVASTLLLVAAAACPPALASASASTNPDMKRIQADARALGHDVGHGASALGHRIGQDSRQAGRQVQHSVGPPLRHAGEQLHEDMHRLGHQFRSWWTRLTTGAATKRA